MHPPVRINDDRPSLSSEKAVLAALVGASLAWKRKNGRVASSPGGRDGAALGAATLAGDMRVRDVARTVEVGTLQKRGSSLIVKGVDVDVGSMAPAHGEALSTTASTPTRRARLARGRSTPLLKPTSVIPSHDPSRDSSTVNLHQLESLTDAIVAGSLASLRMTPHRTISDAISSPCSIAQARSPKLLQTLRQPADEDSDRHHRRAHHGLHTGIHAHHEGSRNKWREEITQRERRRYEGLWASNRGYLLSRRGHDATARDASESESDDDGDASHCVANIVVREIWKRSRLPADELAEIWDLVDRQGGGSLSRQEFVVGMWLVDQRLRGRKMPARVMESVWGSANGVVVRKPRGRWRE